MLATARRSYYASIAGNHRTKADRAYSDHERTHWLREARRFTQLAELETSNPQAARNAYRPTRAYNPDMPIVDHYPASVHITTVSQGTGEFDRDKLSTAFLLWLYAPDSMLRGDAARAVMHTLRTEHGFTGPGEALRYTVAADALIRANINP